MLEMEGRGFLIGARESKQCWLTVQFPEKREAGGSSGAAGAPEIADIVRWRLRGIAAAQTVRQNQRRVPGHVCDDKLFAARGRHDHVKTIEYLCHRIHRHPARPRGLEVFDSGDETGGSKGIRPVVIFLRGEQFIFATTS